MKSVRFYSAIAAAFLFSGAYLRAGSIVIAGPDASLAPSSDQWAWDGSYMTPFTSALTNPAYFGPGGTVSTSITVQDLTTINSTTLAGVNTFVAPYWNSGDSSAYTSLLVSFFMGGGNLILYDDDPGYDGIAAALGFPSTDLPASPFSGNGPPINGGSPLFNGPFGIATNVLPAYDVSSVGTSSSITSAGGFVCGTDGSGDVLAACFNAGVFGPTSGKLLIIGDVDTVSQDGGSDAATYSPLDSNGIFALNGVAWAIGAGSTAVTPEPGTLVLLGGGLALIGLRKFRR